MNFKVHHTQIHFDFARKYPMVAIAICNSEIVADCRTFVDLDSYFKVKYQRVGLPLRSTACSRGATNSQPGDHFSTSAGDRRGGVVGWKEINGTG